jgi:hypothetical protein
VDGCSSDINNAAADSDCSISSAALLGEPDSTASSKEADTATTQSQAGDEAQLGFDNRQVNKPAAPAASVTAARSPSGQLPAPASPLLAASSTTFAPRWRRQLAAAATFFVSGLEHELFMAYATHRIGWRWLAFFSLQGLLLALESGLKRRAAAAGLRLHPAVASLAVLLALGVTADNLFCEWLDVCHALCWPRLGAVRSVCVSRA